jgi:hypothetical protein
MWRGGNAIHHTVNKFFGRKRFTMTTYNLERWILFALLFALVAVTACSPLVAADENTLGNDKPAVDAGAGKTTVYVDGIELLILESFPVQVMAIVRGSLPNGCVVLDDVSAARIEEGFLLEFATHKEGDFCTEALVPFEERVTLDVLGLPAGTYSVRAGEVSSEFTFDVDNSSTDHTPADDTSADGTSTDGSSAAYIQDLRGTVTAVEPGADGVQVTLADGETVYSVTISVLQAEVYGRWEEIQPGAELVVSGPVIAGPMSSGMQPTLVVAERVAVVGDDSDYVTNLHGTVTDVQASTEGITAEVCTKDGTNYRVTIDPKTTELVYLDEETEIQVGTPVLVSGEMFCLIETRIVADVAVVNPAPHL